MESSPRYIIECQAKESVAIQARPVEVVPDESIRVVARQRPFVTDKVIKYIPAGRTIKDIIDEFISPDFRDFCLCFLQNERIDAAWHTRVRPRAGTQVNLVVVPGQIPGPIWTRQNTAMLVGVLAQAGAFAASMLIGGFAGGVIGAVISAISLLAVNSLFKNFDTTSEQLGYSLVGSRNVVTPNGIIPRTIGRVRWAPVKGNVDFTEVVGEQQYLICVLMLGYGPLQLDPEDITINDKPIREYLIDIETSPNAIDATVQEEPFIVYEMHEGYPGESPDLRLVPYDTDELRVDADDSSILNYTDGQGPDDDWREMRTAPRCTDIGIDIEFPDGLGWSADGEATGWSVIVEVQYRLAGLDDDAWRNITPLTAAKVSDFATVLTGGSDPEATIWTYLVQLRDILNDLTDSLATIADVDRSMPVEIATLLFHERERAEEALEQMEPDGTTYPTRPILQSEVITLLGGLIDEISDTFQRVAIDAYTALAPVSNLLNQLGFVLDALAAISEVQRYVARGHGPDLASLGPLQRLMVAIWGLAPIFEDPPENTFRIVGATKINRRFAMQWPVALGMYDVRVRRIQPYSSKDEVLEIGYFTVLRSFDRSQKPIKEKGVAALALRVPASPEFNGTLDQVKVKATSMVRVCTVEDAPYDEWPWQVSRNPAWLALSILLQPNANKSPLSLDEIDMPAFMEWAEFCDDQGEDVPPLTFDLHIAAEATQLKILTEICRAGQAVLTQRNGLYSVLIDQPRTGHVQEFTPSNSRNFVQVQVYVDEELDAIDVQFVNEQAEYNQDVIRVFRPGYSDTGWQERVETFDGGAASITLSNIPAYAVDEIRFLDTDTHVPNSQFDIDLETGELSYLAGTMPGGAGDWQVKYRSVTAIAQKVESIDLLGVTDPYNAWKAGNQFLARILLQPELMTLDVDIEGIVCEIGDVVLVTHPTPLWGLGFGRINRLVIDEDLNLITGLILSNAITMVADVDYVIRVRTTKDVGGAGRIHDEVLAVVNVPGTSYEVELVTPYAEGSSTAPKVGSVFMFGEENHESEQLVVKDIEWQQDLGMRLFLVHYAPEVYTAHLIPIPDFDANVTIPPVDNRPVPPAPVIERLDSDEDVLVLRNPDGALMPRIVVYLRPFQIGSGMLYPSVLQVQYRPTQYVPELLNVVTGDVIDGQILNPPSGWTALPPMSPSEFAPFIMQVQQAVRYDVRVRYVADNGRASAWVMVQNHVVVGQSSPPPNVDLLFLDNFENLRWLYTNPPVDFRGFVIRVAMSETTTWLDAALITNVPISAFTYPVASLPAGPIWVMIKAVDLTGNESAEPAVMSFDNTRTTENVIEEWTFGNGVWSRTPPGEAMIGVWVNPVGHLEGDNLIYTGDVTEDSLIIPGSDSDYIAQQFQSPESGMVCILGEVDTASDAIAPARITYQITMRQGEAIMMVGIDAADPVVMQQGYQLDQDSGVYTFYLVLVPGINGLSRRPVVESVVITFDVPDMEEILEDVSIPAGGARLTLTKPFRVIRVVNPAIQDVPANDARSMLIADKQALPGPNNGPLVTPLDSSGSAVDAVCDFRIRGY